MPPDRLYRLLANAHAGVPDAELVQRVADTRDGTAFELLVRRHAAAVWRVCRAVSGSHHAAEDAFQVTFLALLRKAGSLRTHPAGWLARVATHAALKSRRRSPTLPDDFDTPAPPAPPPDDTAELLHAELDRLADQYRLPLVLCHLHGLTQAEAAARLGWPLGTVATRVKRGCDALRKRLTKRGVVFSAALFGTLSASESAIASAVRLIEPATSVPLPLAQLATEVLRVMSPNLSRPAVAVACGLLVVAGTVGLWPGGAPMTPTATAAPVPPANQTPELVEAWDGLLTNDPKRQTRGTVRLAADPKATVAFLTKRFRPVTVDGKAMKKVLADLDSDDEKTWQAAYRTLQYHDPRLAMTVPDVFAEVKTQAGRHRLYYSLQSGTPADHKAIVKETWYTYSDPADAPDPYQGWFNVDTRTTEDAPDWVARVSTRHVIPSKPENFYRPEWERADRVITLLELFGTDDAVALLKEIAEGHPEAGPTKSAKEAVARLKKK